MRYAHHAFFLAAVLLAAACVDTKADEGYCATCKPDTGTRMDSQVAAEGGTSEVDGRVGDGSTVLDGSMSLDGSLKDGSAVDMDAAADGSTAADSGSDTSVALPCGVTCNGSKPVCDESKGKCVECTSNDKSACPSDVPACDQGVCVECTETDSASCPSDKPVCDISVRQCVECTPTEADACKGSTPVCDVLSNECVQCVGHGDCDDPTAARCVDNECVPCTGDGQCAHLSVTPVCDEGTGKCVACTGDTEAARCGGNSCKRSTGECTGTVLGSVAACGGCEADSECGSGRKCVEQIFGTGPSAVSVGTFCFRPKPVDGCASLTNDDLRPYSKEVMSTSVDTTVEAAYCLPVTTCQAYLDTLTGKSCITNADCGSTALSDDGSCNGSSRCTYACNNAYECPAAGYTSCSGMPGYCN
jgi:hypothetical protein